MTKGIDSVSKLNFEKIKLAELKSLLPYIDSSEEEITKMMLSIPSRSQKRVYLGKLIRSAFAKKCPTVTNIENKVYNLNGIKCVYRYQREFIKYINDDKLKLFYSNEYELDSDNVNGIFTSNCQAITASLFFSISEIFKHCNVEYLYTKNVYFETHSALRKIKELTSSTNALSSQTIALIDSSYTDIKRIGKLDDYLFTIIDTTCWSKADEDLNRLIKGIIENGNPVVLIRSNLKLDSFGLDYGNLGSVATLNTHSFPDVSQELFRVQSANTKNFADFIFENVYHFGGNLNLTDLYPFFLDKNVNELNEKRIKRMRSNCFEIGASLKEAIKKDEGLFSIAEIYELSHGLFFIIKINKDIPKFEKLFLKLFRTHNLNVEFCDSFGFDFMAYNNVNGFSGDDNKTLLRFSAPDVESKELKAITELLIVFLGKITTLKP
jgi:hypothetical protein